MSTTATRRPNATSPRGPTRRDPTPVATSAARGGLHAGAWWLWALGLATAATRTLNPLLLTALLAVLALVVAARRSDAPWAGSLRGVLVLGAGMVVLRVVFEAWFGAPVPGPVLVTLPAVTLPEWMAGVRLGGPVTVAALATAAFAGLQLAAILACVGAAASLAAPTRLLKSVPGALYEVGLALTLTLTLVPQTVVAVRQLRQARRLRGRDDRGPRAWLGTARPLLEGALERSLQLAAALDARGYGRRRHLPRADRYVAAGSLLGGLAGVLVGTYGLLATSGSTSLAVALLLGGCVVAALGVRRAGRRSPRTVYRPDAWTWREWIVLASGAVPALAMVATSIVAPDATAPIAGQWPTLPIVPAAAVLVAALPAVVASPPQRASRQAPP